MHRTLFIRLLRDLVLAGMLALQCLSVWAAEGSGRELTPASLVAMAGSGSVMLRTPGGDDLVRVHPDRPLIPASLVKIPVAQVALSTLGEHFRFETHFHGNADGDLLIRGLGDPFLVSEEVALIAAALAERGVSRIRRLVVDDSAFEPDLIIPGQSETQQPYGAINGALAVNFNTVNLARSADGRLTSAEPQTPLTPHARGLAAGLAAGDTVRINLGSDPLSGLRQVQQLFRLLLEREGISVSDADFYREPVSEDWELLYRHRSSKSLRENLEGLLQYSNNFIANQLFLTLGAQEYGYPATLEKAQRVLVDRLQAVYGDGFGSQPQKLLATEGSGLSREQRTTGAGMMHILEQFRPHASLLAEVDGVYRKSGTLTGVYNFAGYIPGPDGLYPFVILTNQADNRRAAILRDLQARVMRGNGGRP
ncbi:MAG: D-alanyl-D-alanine carboxypeptidase [Pseudohongiellaceae bacterium]